jgi:dihydrofolate reductase
MLKASVFCATSLDGFIARPDGGLDWLPVGGGEEHGYDAFVKSVDAIVMGRNTFDVVLGFGGWHYGTKPVFVLTSRPLPAPPPKGAVLETLSGMPEQVASQLEARGHRHVYLDGGITIQRFLRAGLVQRLVITRIPVLLGAGIPLFGSLPHDIKLHHEATRHYASGLVQSEYTVKG